jgi:MtN3 and saliva related transmembrane protein
MPWFMLEILGYGAAICTTVAFAPQLVKAWRTRSTNDISLAMFLVMDRALADSET